VNFVTCPKQGLQIEAVVLHRVGFLEHFCAKQGQDFKPSAAPLYLNMGQVPPLPGLPALALTVEPGLKIELGERKDQNSIEQGCIGLQRIMLYSSVALAMCIGDIECAWDYSNGILAEQRIYSFTYLQ